MMVEREFEHRGQKYRVLVRHADLDWKPVRGSGPGGQHRNKVETGMRVTHRPTGYSATATDSKSRQTNIESALERLMGSLQGRIIIALEQHRMRKVTPRFGSADRSYVLDKDPRVVDHRTGHACTSPQAVLGGKIDEFIVAALSAGTRGERRDHGSVD